MKVQSCSYAHTHNLWTALTFTERTHSQCTFSFRSQVIETAATVGGVEADLIRYDALYNAREASRAPFAHKLGYDIPHGWMMDRLVIAEQMVETNGRPVGGRVTVKVLGEREQFFVFPAKQACMLSPAHSRLHAHCWGAEGHSAALMMIRIICPPDRRGRRTMFAWRRHTAISASSATTSRKGTRPMPTTRKPTSCLRPTRRRRPMCRTGWVHGWAYEWWLN